jgi:hypothetical protein
MRTRAKGESALLLLDVAAVLRSRSVSYAVIGAMAGAVHGVIRASVDADAIVSLAVTEAAALREAMADAGFNAELKRGDFNDPIPAMLVLKDKYGNRVDVLVGLKGLDQNAFDRAVEVPMSGERIRVVTREDFIAMKLFAGGPLDLRDAQQAIKISPDTLDLQLLRALCTRFGRHVASKLDSLLADLSSDRGNLPSR